MNIVSPSVEIITEPNPLKRIELCGRVCYKSEDRITDDSAEKFVDRLIESGHTSVLEHARIAIGCEFPCDVVSEAMASLGDTQLGGDIWPRILFPRPGVLTINARDYLRLFPKTKAAELAKFENADNYMTVRFVCDRAIANELVRHRVFSFSQESTRYVNYKEGVTFVAPEPYGERLIWFTAMKEAERAYLDMIEAGCAPQEARNVLPLSTKTELVMTGTLEQWKEVLKLRRAPGAHPQMIYLMNKLVRDTNFPVEALPEGAEK